MYVLDTNVSSELRKGKKAERSVRIAHGKPLLVRHLSAELHRLTIMSKRSSPDFW